MIRYRGAPDVCCLVKLIVENLKDFFGHIDTSRIKCFRSIGSKSYAYARIHGLPRIWLKALQVKPVYIIEVLSERYDGLSIEDKIKVLIHELLHIPSSFSGGLRPHGKYVNNRLVVKLYQELTSRKGLGFLLRNTDCFNW